jgi:hypothetical protein
VVKPQLKTFPTCFGYQMRSFGHPRSKTTSPLPYTLSSTPLDLRGRHSYQTVVGASKTPADYEQSAAEVNNL